MMPLLDHPAAGEALGFLQADFATARKLGPIRVAKFITRRRDDDIQASVVAYVGELLRAVEKALEP